jgi:flagellar motor switch protein FliN/FliY
MPDPIQHELPEADNWLLDAWNAHFEEVLEAMTGERPQCSVTGTGQKAEAPADGGDFLWWEQPVTLTPDAAIWIGTPEPTWYSIGKRALSIAGIDDAETEDIRQTYEEILGQAVSSEAQTIGGRVGEEVNAEMGRHASEPPPHPCAILQILYPGDDPLPVLIAFHPDIAAALAQDAAPAAEATSAAATSSDTAVGVAEPPPAPVGEADMSPKTAELLLDVELPVSVSFGRAHLLLKDVLKLSSGSIVELNRAINDPVEIIVNNCVIARGEVVVVEGNYGVRIDQIISRRERLRTLN